MGSTAPNSYSTNSTRPARHSLHVASTGNISAGSSQPRRYLELCINTSRRHICLRELLLNGSGSKPTQSDIQTDAQLFQKIHDTYLEVRRGSRFSFLYSPIDIHFVQFSTFDGGRVGIYEKPMALPPVEQVRNITTTSVRSNHYRPSTIALSFITSGIIQVTFIQGVPFFSTGFQRR
jgi:hypothetical protein